MEGRKIEKEGEKRKEKEKKNIMKREKKSRKKVCKINVRKIGCKKIKII